jgi:hypothetical protein
MSERTLSDQAMALTLGAATLLGITAGMGLWAATPRQLQLTSYGLFGAASLVFVVILVLVGISIARPAPGWNDGGLPPAAQGPIPPTPELVPAVLDELDYQLEVLFRQS